MKRFKPKTRFAQVVALIIFAVVFNGLFSNLNVVADAVKFVLNVFQPLMIGGILAFFLNVPMRTMERLLARVHPTGKLSRRWEKSNRIFSLILTYLSALLVIFLIFYIVVPQVVQAVPGVVESVEAAYPRFIAFLQRHNIDTASLESLTQNLDLGLILETISLNLETIVQTSLSAVTSVFSALVLALTGVVISVYILANKRKLMRQAQGLLYAYVDRRHADKIMEIASLTNKTFSSFLAGQCMEAVILGLLFSVVLSILRMPFAVIISVLIAVTALIPYVGAFIGCVFGALLILTVSPAKALLFVAVFLVLQQLEDQLIYPKVVGTSVGLSAMWILVAVYAGGKLFGVVGMMFFIPLTSVLYSIMRIHVQNRLKRRKLEVDENGVRSTNPDSEEPDQDENE